MHGLVIAGDSVSATTGAASATVALPTTADGNKARFVRVQAKGNAYLRPVQSGGTVTAVNGMLVTVNEAVILNVNAFSHLAHIQDAAAIVLSITPLEVA